MGRFADDSYFPGETSESDNFLSRRIIFSAAGSSVETLASSQKLDFFRTISSGFLAPSPTEVHSPKSGRHTTPPPPSTQEPWRKELLLPKLSWGATPA